MQETKQAGVKSY